MRLQALGIDYDRRIRSFMVNARADYDWYLSKTHGSEDNLKIQRDIIKGTKAYRTLRADLKIGCVLPAIVLAIRNIDTSFTDKYSTEDGFIDADLDDLMYIEEAISSVRPRDVDIIDGLQRTNALRQAAAELNNHERQDYLRRSLRIEIWIGIPFYSLAYRMILLNAGQKPMSMKHQIDILSGGLAEDLRDIRGIDIITLKDHKRRVRAGQYHLSTLAQAFQAWLQRSPNVDKSNMVVESLMVDDALDFLGIDLNSGENAYHRDSFRYFIKWLVQFDMALGIERNKFLSNDTVVLGFAAAVGFAHKSDQLRDRMKPALDKMLEDTKNEFDDLIGIEVFDKIRRGIDTRRSNVGEATRELVFRAVREYIIQDGATSISECWIQAASMM